MKLSQAVTGRRSPPPYIANFDSSTTLLRATARYLRGEDFPRVGSIPKALKPLQSAANYLPRRSRQTLYTWGGANEAISPKKLSNVRTDEIHRWVTRQYPRRGYPAVIVGSANGAAVHLAALLGIPWLPQTFLIPIKRRLSPDAAKEDLEWGREPGRVLLEANPDLQLHQMHDPNQDRLLVERLAYFRVKSLRLSAAYEQFLKTVLAQGGTIFLLECDLSWPITQVDDRHVYQFGGLAELPPQEYFEGSDRIEAFLDRQGAPQSQWNPPEPDGKGPEAEWGFEPTLRNDITRFAEKHGHRIRRIRFEKPHDLSPLVADLYRQQYADRGISTDRLLVESFALLNPWWALRTGSVPYWMTFNAQSDAQALEAYLECVPEPYDEIRMVLISHGLESAGMASSDRWQSVLRKAQKRGEFVGVDPQAYPLDLETYVRYRDDLAEDVSDRYPLPSPLPLTQLDAFLEAPPRQYPVQWIDE